MVKQFVILLCIAVLLTAFSLEDEAKKEALQYLTKNNYITVCGDSFYVYVTDKGVWDLIQGKDFQVALMPDKDQKTVEPAPKRFGLEWKKPNASKYVGVEWSGEATLKPKTERQYSSSGKWTDWDTDDSYFYTILLGLRKVNGQWSFTPFNQKSLKDGKPLSCKDITALTK